MFLRRFVRPSSLKMMSSASQFKETAAASVGPDVVPTSSREVLISLYSKTLNIITRVPENEGYRQSMEALTRQRLAVCVSDNDVESIEKRIGKVDELIQEAKFEYKVLDKLLEWDPWGVNDDYVSEEMQNGIEIPKPAAVDLGPLPEDFFATLEAAAKDLPPLPDPSAMLKAIADKMRGRRNTYEDKDKDKDKDEDKVGLFSGLGDCK